MLSTQIKSQEAELKAYIALKAESVAIAGLMREIQSGQVVSVHVSPSLADYFLAQHESSINYYTQKILQIQTILSVLTKALEAEPDHSNEKVSA